MSTFKKVAVAGGALLAGGGLLFGGCGFYTVPETEQAVITNWGAPVRVIVGSDEAGQVNPERVAEVTEWVRQYEQQNRLPQGSIEVEASADSLLRWRFIIGQGVRILPDTLLEYNADPREVTTGDKRQITIDTYARWRITNPLLFLNRMQSEEGAGFRLDGLIFSAVRSEVGKYDLDELIRTNNDPIQTLEGEVNLEDIEYGRENILTDILDEVNNGGRRADGSYEEGALSYGIEVVDIRIRQAELPQANEEAVFQRMISERQRIASLYRAEGQGRSAAIRAETDRQAAEINSVAYRDAQQTRGLGDAESTEIYANAFSQDPEFFQFWRSLQAYVESFGPDAHVRVVLPLDSEFTQYLMNSEGLGNDQ